MPDVTTFRCSRCGETYRRRPARCALCAWVARCREEFRALVEHGADLGSLEALDDYAAFLPSQFFVLRAIGGLPA